MINYAQPIKFVSFEVAKRKNEKKNKELPSINRETRAVANRSLCDKVERQVTLAQAGWKFM